MAWDVEPNLTGQTSCLEGTGEHGTRQIEHDSTQKPCFGFGAFMSGDRSAEYNLFRLACMDMVHA